MEEVDVGEVVRGVVVAEEAEMVEVGMAEEEMAEGDLEAVD